ncbi:TonB-dependent receptor [Pseudoalteromonas luteoviolacea]|uniref:TonB-dependent receptor n=1 Tax=Pseudoalteromonas luteoviolacea TaxID=43657 RepID=UPI00114F1F33|nr:TonB-dependent receptor [Pseudoalteromonas luteoviolacea]TQF68029.1 TonB-dependent receptor [Pseudoalteromonas luteoviolacea]
MSRYKLTPAAKSGHTLSKLSSHVSRAVLALSLSTTACSVYADEQTEQIDLERIEVTSEKRTANIMEVASSVTAIFGQELADSEVYSITELGHEIPSLHVYSWGGRRDSNVFIRGIGPGLFTEPTIGFYVDGVNYSSNSIFDLDLVDIERVEVLRGPQGTLYGGNSLAGVINIITKQPDEVQEFKGTFSADNLGSKRVRLGVNTPINDDDLFLGVSLSAHNSDGHIENTYLNKDFGARDDISARTKLRWIASDTLEANFVVDYERFRGDSYAMGLIEKIKANPDQVEHDFEGVDDRDALGASITLDYAGDNVDFISITSWRDWDNFNTADQDTGHDAGYQFHSNSTEKFDQLSHEMRWSSKNTEDYHWLVGIYAYQANTHNTTRNDLNFAAMYPGSGPMVDRSITNKDDQAWAAFGQVDYAITDDITVIAGLRYHKEQREADITINSQSTGVTAQYDGEKEFSEVLPKLALSYQTGNDDLIYASWSKGYRAGGFDTLYPNLSKPSFEPEYSNNYEIAYKALALDNQLSFSVTAFYISLDDQQVQQMLENTTVITDNAGKSASRGVEFESRYQPHPDWTVGFSSSYVDATYSEYKSLNFATGVVEDYSDNRLPNTPKFSANLSVSNRTELNSDYTLFTQLENIYMGEHYFDAGNQMKQSAFHLLNAKVGLETENWYAHLWVKNALDEYYSKVEFNFGFGVTAEAGNPRTIGLTVGTNF